MKDEYGTAYAQELLKRIKDIEIGLKYYINKSQKLELENRVLSEMYENSVEERLNKVKENKK